MNKIEELIEKKADLTNAKREILNKILSEAEQEQSKKKKQGVLKKKKKENRQQNIELTKEEAMLLISVIRQNAGDDEKKKIDSILKQNPAQRDSIYYSTENPPIIRFRIIIS